MRDSPAVAPPRQVSKQLMSSQKLTVSVLTLIAMLAPCTSACQSGNVTYGKSARAQQILSVYYDRYGNMYPDGAVNIDDAALRHSQQDQTRILNIKAYFADSRRNADWSGLLESLGVASTGQFDRDWNEVQERQRVRLQGLIASASEKRTLVILIHGYNNGERGVDAWYGAARDSIAARLRMYHGTPPTFLHVYWDGLASINPLRTWAAAQYNFPLIGLEFRRLLNGLDSLKPMRILTHSSGGPLVISALGDGSAVLPIARNPGSDLAYQHYKRVVAGDSAEYHLPRFRDLRVAMVIPATANGAFDGYSSRSVTPQVLILGVNPNDVAAGKGPLRCGTSGDSCLGIDLKHACATVRGLADSLPATQSYVVDLSNAESGNDKSLVFWEDHSMKTYLERSTIAPVLALLLRPAGPQVADARATCPVRNLGAWQMSH